MAFSRFNTSMVSALLACLLGVSLAAVADTQNSFSLPEDRFGPVPAASQEPAPAASQGAGSAAIGDYAVVGNAYLLATNQLLYRELFSGLDQERRVQVHYANPRGDRFANKTLNYRGEPFQPELELSDIRDDEEVRVFFEGPRLNIHYRKGGQSRKQVIYDNAKVVVDAGIDAFVQLNWETLVNAKKRLRFDYLTPLQSATESLEVRWQKASDSPLYDPVKGGQWVYLRISPARALDGLLGKSRYLAYDPNGRFLMRYQGSANLDSYEGKPWDVRIEYEYKD